MDPREPRRLIRTLAALASALALLLVPAAHLSPVLRVAQAASVADSFTYPFDPVIRTLLIPYDYQNPALTQTNGCYYDASTGTYPTVSQLWHSGEDWFPSTGTATPIYAVANGIVKYVLPNLNYPGAVVIIQHTLPNGSSVYSMYGHLDPTKLDVHQPASGEVETVTKGQEIASGLVYQSYNGNANVHLHWEMRYFASASGIKIGPSYTTSCALQAGAGYTWTSDATLAHPDKFVYSYILNGTTYTATYRWTNPSRFIATHTGIPANLRLTLPFARQANMHIGCFAWLRCTDSSVHAGIDYFKGTNWSNNPPWVSFSVLAAADGYACTNPPSHDGNAVYMQHRDPLSGSPLFYTYYGHLATFAAGLPACSQPSSTWVFKPRGAFLGTAGSTCSSGCPVPIHLHFQVNVPTTWSAGCSSLLGGGFMAMDPYNLCTTGDHDATSGPYPDPNSVVPLASSVTAQAYDWTTNPASPPIIYATFNDNLIDPTIWVARSSAPDSTVRAVNQRIEISLGPHSTPWNGIGTVCSVHGDFDVRVSFKLLQWPSNDGTLLALGGLPFAVEFVNGYSGTNANYYLVDFGNNVQGAVQTTDTSGSLRLTRHGNSMNAYYLHQGTWVSIATSTSSTENFVVGVGAWNNNSDTAVHLAVDNFWLSQGRLMCS